MISRRERESLPIIAAVELARVGSGIRVIFPEKGSRTLFIA
jgi:hypothetical protein